MKITQTKTGGYTTVVSIGKDVNGKQHTKRFSSWSKDQLKRDVKDYISKHRIAAESHQFRHALERYIIARDGLRSPSTIRGYRAMQKALEDEEPDFCNLRTDDINSRNVQAVVNNMLKSGLSEKTVRNRVGLINATLTFDGAPPTKPLMPPKKVIDREIPTECEITMMLCLLHGTRLEVPFQLGLLGMRRGEICALTMDDLDKKNVLHIHKAMVMDEDGFLLINDVPKTDTSNRFIRLPDHLADQIRKQGYFTKFTINGLTDSYIYFRDKYNFPKYRFHDLRHFFVSYCHEHGIPEADILAGGGWKTPNIMRSVYRHAMAKNKATAKIGSFLERIG